MCVCVGEAVKEKKGHQRMELNVENKTDPKKASRIGIMERSYISECPLNSQESLYPFLPFFFLKLKRKCQVDQLYLCQLN